MHFQAMLKQVVKLTEQCGDVNLAMQMMRLDQFEIRSLQEYFYLQQQQQMIDTMQTKDVDQSEGSFGLKSKSQDILRSSEFDAEWATNDETKQLARQPPSTRILSWLDWFCELEAHKFVTKIDIDFIQDLTNL